ncbi:MAG: hypothetical protein CVU03_14105, partial [Bacteroidetes bacterium HGW-Bacteroidetes-2]
NSDHKIFEFNDGTNTVVLTPVTPSRKETYKYKFQGQEHQDEFGLNWDSFKYRNYMPDIGRFFNVDPLTEKYNSWSPFAFSGNRVIDARELEGLEPHSVHNTLDGAAINFGQQYNGRSIINKKEYASRFYSTTKNGKTTYSYVEPLSTNGSISFIPDESTIPKGTSNAGDIHSHGNDEAETIEGETDADNVPSYQDIESTKEGNLPSYVVIPLGKVLKIDPKTGEVTTVSTDVPSDPASGSKRTNTIEPSLGPYVPSRPKIESTNEIIPKSYVPEKFDSPYKY